MESCKWPGFRLGELRWFLGKDRWAIFWRSAVKVVGFQNHRHARALSWWGLFVDDAYQHAYPQPILSWPHKALNGRTPVGGRFTPLELGCHTISRKLQDRMPKSIGFCHFATAAAHDSYDSFPLFDFILRWHLISSSSRRRKGSHASCRTDRCRCLRDPWYPGNFPWEVMLMAFDAIYADGDVIIT